MKSCLIVDDSSTIRMIVRNMMEEFGFSCTEAENGQRALDCCRRSLPDLIMLDWNMPVVSGIEFATSLGTENAGAIPPIIFCTTEKDISFIERAMNAGAVDYIMKPFEKEMLRSKLVYLGFLEEAEHCQ